MRQAFLVGAVFGGENGKEYMQTLIDAAWWDDYERADKAKGMLDVAEARRGHLADPPRGKLET